MYIKEEVEIEDLPNLAKSTFYMRDFNYSRDVYMHVHSKAMVMLG
jgi:hypothetical protein